MQNLFLRCLAWISVLANMPAKTWCLLKNAIRNLLHINKLIIVGRVKRNIFNDLQVFYELNTGKGAGVFIHAARNPPLYSVASKGGFRL